MIEDYKSLLVKQLTEAHGKWKLSSSPNELMMIETVNAGKNAFKKLEKAIEGYDLYRLKKGEGGIRS